VRAHLYNILARSESAMTVRQVFYQAVSRGVIAKTEGEYKSTVCRLLTDMRLDGVIPFGWIAENTRWMRKPRTYSSMESALENTASTYRRQVWDNQGAYVEIWLEKEALAGVVVDITSEFDVPLMVTRGYPSVGCGFAGVADSAPDLIPIAVAHRAAHTPSVATCASSTVA
jgi:hypothetical protein